MAEHGHRRRAGDDDIPGRIESIRTTPAPPKRPRCGPRYGRSAPPHVEPSDPRRAHAVSETELQTTGA